MKPYFEHGGLAIYCGDCREVLPQLSRQYSAVVTDPPYGLSFMGQGWDRQVPDSSFWLLFLSRCLPGCNLLSFGGTRTWHRLACAIEDAGWELRDTLMWLYGSGFPKSLDVSKAIDKKLGVKRTEKKLVNRYHDGILRTEGKPGRCNIKIGGSVHSNHKSLPSTDLAKQWDGWGTALKPAYEPILFCRSPLDGTVVDTVLEYGAGAINIEGCRVEGGDTTTRHNSSSSYMTRKIGYKQPKQESYVTGSTLGRFPANVIHDGSDEVMELFPDVKSGGHGGYRKPQDKGFVHSASGTNPDSYFNEPSSGSAARFFYTAKASQSERSELTQDRNSHPTVKPLALMEYLLKLVTPPQGVILDPFMGSGTTLVAAQRLGFRCVGIELEERYCKIAAQRLAQLSLFPPQQQKETGT